MQLLMIGAAVIVLIGVAAVEPWHREHNPQFNDDSLLETWVKLGSPSVPVKRVRRAHKSHAGVPTGLAHDWSHLPSRTDLGISDEARDILMDLEQETGGVVPAWAVVGIWSNESDRLNGGWYEDRPWVPARSIIEDGSRCRQARGNKCFEAWDALRQICAQRRSDGSAVCNPNEVWVSWTGAMGATQMMPRPFILNRDGNWKDYMVDYDGDGVIDPHSLPDALASTTTCLWHGVARYGSLSDAVQAYAGNTPHDHYAKLRRNYRAQWCSVEGYCHENTP